MSAGLSSSPHDLPRQCSAPVPLEITTSAISPRRLTRQYSAPVSHNDVMFNYSSPINTSSPSHFSDPISIKTPRRRLNLNIGEAEFNSRDSGFDSPTTASHLRRANFQQSSNVIYEHEDENPWFENSIASTVFQFDEDRVTEQPNHLLKTPSKASLSGPSTPVHHYPPLHRHLNFRSFSEPPRHYGHYELMSPLRSSPRPSSLYLSGSFEGRRRTSSDPTAPPLHLYDEYEGYELTTAFSSVYMLAPSSCFHGNEPPPPYEEHPKEPQSYPSGTLTEDDAVDALTTFLADRCCSSSNTKHLKNKVKTKQILSGNGHHYVLETFYEERTTIWHQEPYTSQTIDGPDNGQPPPAWDIQVSKPTMFQPKEVFQEVPHTASIKDCTYCHGKGTRQCTCCHGSGDIKCTVCDGLGILHHFSPDELTYERTSNSVASRSCHHCNSGRRSCKHCEGEGRTQCTTCQGQGALKTYIRLAVKWKVLKGHKVIEGSQLPTKCIAEVSGSLVFQEENDRVYPLIDFPEDEINEMSRSLISNHKDQLKHARVIMQRHCVREVPVAEVLSEFNKKEFTYWVYGNENQVYCPSHPVKCYGGQCNII